MGRRFRTLAFLLVLLVAGVLMGPSLFRKSQGPPVGSTTSSLSGIPGRVRVEVLNGAGIPGVAWEATRLLRDQGFDVVNYGNAGTYSDRPSVVMDRVGKTDVAESVARALGILVVRPEPDSTLLVDITVHLGPDWKEPQAGVNPIEEGTPWWDVRRFFRKKAPQDSDNS